MNGDIEDNFIGKLLVEMKSNFNKSAVNYSEDTSIKVTKDKSVKSINKVQKTEENEEKGTGAINVKITDLKVQDKIKNSKRTKSCEIESVKRSKVTSNSQIVQSYKMQDVQAQDNDINSSMPIEEHSKSEPEKILENTAAKESKNKEFKDKLIVLNVSPKLNSIEDNKIDEMKEVKESASPGRRSLRLKIAAPENVKSKGKSLYLM